MLAGMSDTSTLFQYSFQTMFMAGESGPTHGSQVTTLGPTIEPDFTCIIDNTADRNDDDGIDVRSENNDIQGNQANNNLDDGFDINDAPNTLTDNIANFNDDDGIELDDAEGDLSEDECLFGALVQGNTANSNGDIQKRTRLHHAQNPKRIAILRY